MTPPRIIPVAPVGTEKTAAFVCPGGLREVDVDVYPPHPRGKVLRSMRRAFDLGLREATALVGVTASELCGLERGSRSLESDAAWCELYATLAAEYERREDERRAKGGEK